MVQVKRETETGVASSLVQVSSEIGRVKTVICHTPGSELLAVTPATRQDFLYNDIIDVEQARREHQRFQAILSRFAEVHEVRALLEDVLEVPETRSFLIERVMDVARSEPLAKHLQERPAADLVNMFIEGWATDDAGPLQRVLNLESYALPPLPNLFFTRDASVVIGSGVLIGSMRHTVRWTEEILMKALFTYHPLLGNSGLIYDGSEERRAGFTIEGGDVHILRSDLALIGMSERSTPAAFDTVASRLVQAQGITDILVVIMPIDRSMIHLDMIFTMIDRERCVVFPPSFIGPTRHPVLHYCAQNGDMREMPNLFAALRQLGMPLEPIYCGGARRTLQEREQWSSGCNFFAIRPGLLLGYSRNEETYRELEREAGYSLVDSIEFLTGEADIAEDELAIITFEGSELVRGGGGARCMTLPVRREELA